MANPIQSPFSRAARFFEVERLNQELEEIDLLKFELYTDFEMTGHSRVSPLLKSYQKMYDQTLNFNSNMEYRQYSFSRIDPTSFEENDGQGLSRRRSLEIESQTAVLETDRMSPYLKSVVQRFESLGRVRLAVMLPGSRIRPHVDYGKNALNRIHLPLRSNQQCRFFIKKSSVVFDRHLPADGSAYHLEVHHQHWVVNEGSEPRLHLIIDTFQSIDQIGFEAF